MGASEEASAAAAAAADDDVRDEDDADRDSPRDAKVVKGLLRSMGVKQHEPRVVHQFLDFWYRYAVELLGDAHLYSEHAGKASIDLDDLKLAISARTSAGLSFSQPPPREVLMELARVRNSIPLPKAISGPSIALPPEQDMLVAPNYQIAVQAVKNVDEVEAEDGGASHTPTTSSERNGMPPPSTQQQQQQHHHMVDHDNARKVTFSLSGTKRPLS